MEKTFSFKLSGDELEIFEELRGEKTAREMIEQLIRHYPTTLIEYAKGRDTDDLLDDMIKTYEEWRNIRWVPDELAHDCDKAKKWLGLDNLSKKATTFELKNIEKREVKVYKM